MLVSQRITALQRLEMRLRRLVKDEALLRSALSSSSSSSVHASVATKQHDELRRSAALKDKILFREVPVALSLLERSFLSLIRQEKASVKKSCGTEKTLTYREGEKEEEDIGKISPLTRLPYSDSALVSSESKKADIQEGNGLLGSGGLSSSERVIIMRRPEYTGYLISSLHFVEQERRKLYRDYMGKLESKLRSAEKTLHGIQKRHKDKHTLKAAKEAVTETKEDIMLLQSSLLSRPYISARLWRLLLREEIWIAAIQQSRRKSNENEVSTASSVVVMLLSFTRIGFGALRDVVKGHVLNTRAPRFVASLPSRKMRNKSKIQKDLNVKKSSVDSSVPVPTASVTPTTNSSDPMMAMMLEMITAPSEMRTGEKEDNKRKGSGLSQNTTQGGKISETKSSNSHTTKTISQLRWLPPSSCDVAPLVLETLAMCSHVLPLLDITHIVIHSGEVQEFFELLSVLQASASSLLFLLYTLEGNGKVAIMHQTLHRLEDAMLNSGEIAKRALVTQVTEKSLDLPPIKAARLLLGLESMKLLKTDEYDSQKLLTQLVMCMFPQLSTGTHRALLEKSRENSLFAFATRGHREKLYREHGKRGAESALLNSARAMARLQQRQMQAALRMKHLEEVNSRGVGQLAKELPVHSLISLFDVLVRAARDAPRQRIEIQSRLITAALFVVESVLVSRERFLPKSDKMFHPNDLSSLLVALSVLWPLVTERYQIMQNMSREEYDKKNFNMKGKKGAASDPIAKSEILMVSYVKDMVFNAVNAAMAERVEAAELIAEQKRATEFGPILSVKDIMNIVNVLFEWSNIPTRNKNNTHLETTARLMKRLLVTDMQLWQELRQIKRSEREQFMRTLSDVLRRLNMMDTAVTEALSTIG